MPQPAHNLSVSPVAQAAVADIELEARPAFREFSIHDCEPDWTDGRYRVYAAWGEADCIRYGQGKRYDFCVSRRHHNYYHDYRARYNSSYYFVYDDACSPYDKTHVTVVAACSDGSHGFTFATNEEDSDTRRFGKSLARFLATKPGLERAQGLFVCQPLTPAETADISAARSVVAGNVAFDALTPAQQLMYVRLGSPLTDAGYEQAADEVRDAYIARAHLLTDHQASCSTEAQRRRAAQLFRLYNAAERLRTAAWLQAYPLPTPAIVTAHYTSAWPPGAANLANWCAPTPTLPAVMEAGGEGPGPMTNGTTGKLCLSRLEQAVAANPPALFPVQELRANPSGAASGQVIIARQRDGLMVLTGNALLSQAQLDGEVDITVRLATRANLAYARAEATPGEGFAPERQDMAHDRTGQ